VRRCRRWLGGWGGVGRWGVVWGVVVVGNACVAARVEVGGRQGCAVERCFVLG